MTDKRIFSKRVRSFFLYLLFAMVVLVIIIAGLVMLNDYYTVKNIFDKNSQHLKQQTEQDIIITVRLSDQSFNLYDSSLNEQMRRGFEYLMEEYERSARNPSQMNLTEVKNKLGDEFDIYIINESGVIEFTTYEPELGLDFKTIPYFFEYLHEGLISGEMHLGIGQEGIVAGVLDHLGDGDAVGADHRSTPSMVMRGVDFAAIVAECLGAVGGLGRGLGGHMHLDSKEHLAASSGIVGSSGPLACGFALAHQQLRPDRVAVAFFGEGAMNQGMLLESLNLAGCWRLPVVFVCKDNGMAITTPSGRITSGNLPDRVRGFELPAVELDGADVETVWQAAAEAILRARRGGGPGYLHASCVRPVGHFLGDPLQRIVRHPV